MHSLLKRISLATLTILTVLAFTVAHAQSSPIDLAITAVPNNPLPSQAVTLTAQSFSTDLSQATMTWSYNGKTVATGKGRTTITVTAPGGGQTGTISASASGGFDTAVTSIILRPASVDLLWEGADSYTAPFYKGLPLPSTGGVVRVQAVPSISAPRQLSFMWKRNGEALQSASGNGKSSLLFRHDDLINSETIDVTETNGSFSGSNTVTVTPGKPIVAGYFNHDGFIDYSNGSVSSLSTQENGVLVHFEPYFISSPRSLARDVRFSYTDAVGSPLTPASIQNEIALSRPDSGGRSDFDTAVSTIVFSLQNIVRRFTVNFN